MEETADRAEAEGRAETVLGAAAWERPFEPVTGAGAVGAEWVVEVVNALPDVPSRRPARVDGDGVTPMGRVGAPPSSRALSSASVVDRADPPDIASERARRAPVLGEADARVVAVPDDEAEARRREGKAEESASPALGSAARGRGIAADLSGADGRWAPGPLPEPDRAALPGEGDRPGTRAASPPEADDPPAPAASDRVREPCPAALR